jgi:uncharacterized phage protein (TIGR01671 family)
MREIKFRAWDKTNNKWCETSPSVGWVLNTDTHETGIQFYGLTDGNIELMQYTGLKDKNGKEIYEKDIVKRGKDVQVVSFDEFCFDGYYTITGFGIGTPTAESYSFGIDVAKEWEVIGNLYENSELLK